MYSGLLGFARPGVAEGYNLKSCSAKFQALILPVPKLSIVATCTSYTKYPYMLH
jgi:hypothetical protein